MKNYIFELSVGVFLFGVFLFGLILNAKGFSAIQMREYMLYIGLIIISIVGLFLNVYFWLQNKQDRVKKEKKESSLDEGN